MIVLPGKHLFMNEQFPTRSITSPCLAAVFLFGAAISLQAEDKTMTVPAAPTNPAVTNPPPQRAIAIDVAAFDNDRIMTRAKAAMALEPLTITKRRAKLSPGGPNDFYSMADYWWPNAASPTGLPYVKRDGQINPKNFADHRKCLLQFRDNVTALAAAYKVTGNNRYAEVAVEWLQTFFLDPKTRMNPNLQYVQAIPGVSEGRSLGIADSLP